MAKLGMFEKAVDPITGAEYTVQSGRGRYNNIQTQDGETFKSKRRKGEELTFVKEMQDRHSDVEPNPSDYWI